MQAGVPAGAEVDQSDRS